MEGAGGVRAPSKEADEGSNDGAARRGGDLGRGRGARARPGFGAAVIWGRVLGERRG